MFRGLFSLLCAAFVSVLVQAETLYVQPEEENLRDGPNGRVITQLSGGTKVEAVEENGSWVRVQVEGWIWKPSVAESAPSKQGSALEVLSFDIVRVPENTAAGRYNDSVRLSLRLKNHGSQTIAAWQGVWELTNPFDDVIFKGGLQSGDSNIMPGGEATASFEWDDNQFMKDDAYDRLTRFAVKNLTGELTEIKLAFD